MILRSWDEQKTKLYKTLFQGISLVATSPRTCGCWSHLARVPVWKTFCQYAAATLGYQEDN